MFGLGSLTPIQVRLAIAAAAASVAFGSGWAVNGWRLNAKHDREAREVAEVTRVTLAQRTAERDALQARLTASDDAERKKLQEAQDETNRLRDCLRNGTCGLRIAAKCPARLPQADPVPSVDTGTGAELDRPAEQAYFALRDGINRASAQLAACQKELTLRQ